MIEHKNITFHHQMPAQLRFSDVDSFGHINNTVYFQLFDMCKADYFRETIGGHIFEGCGLVVVHVEADFVAPIYFPDEIAIRTAVTHIGTKSITLYQEAFNVRTNETKCLCETVMVMMDTNKMCSMNISDDFREKFREKELETLDIR